MLKLMVRVLEERRSEMGNWGIVRKIGKVGKIHSIRILVLGSITIQTS